MASPIGPCRCATRLWSRYAVVVACLLGVPAASWATDYYWNTTSTSIWATIANWSTDPVSGGSGAVPTITDTATFNQSSVNGNEIVLLDGAQSVLGLIFGSSD